MVWNFASDNPAAVSGLTASPFPACAVSDCPNYSTANAVLMSMCERILNVHDTKVGIIFESTKKIMHFFNT